MLNACEPCVYIHDAAAVVCRRPCVRAPRRTFRLRVCACLHTFALRQDHGRGRVCAVADACYGDEVCLFPLPLLYRCRHNDETNVTIILYIYREGWKSYVPKRRACVHTGWTWTDDHSRVPMQPPASTLTTWHLQGVEFQCTCHCYVTSTTPCGVRAPCDARVGTILPPFLRLFTWGGGQVKTARTHENMAECNSEREISSRKSRRSWNSYSRIFTHTLLLKKKKKEERSLVVILTITLKFHRGLPMR